MEARNCRKCKKMFGYISTPICPSCVKEEEAEFLKVKTFIVENRATTLKEVSTETNVSLKKIQGYIHEGRLDVTNSSNISLACVKCGKPIFIGKLCSTCQEKTHKQITGVANSLKPSDSPNSTGAKMHTQRTL